MSNGTQQQTQALTTQSEAKKASRGLEEVMRDTSSLMKFREALGDLDRYVSADKLVRVVLTAVNNDYKLLQCNPRTILASTMQLAQIGLIPDGFLGQAYLVPFDNSIKRNGEWIKELQATTLIGYKGYGELIARSGKAQGHDAQVVFANDLFEFEMGSEPFLRHRRTLGNRGEPIGAYAIIWQKEGPARFEIMDLDELGKIQANARGANKDDSPWKKWWAEMARKSPLRRLAKYVPLSQEFSRAATIDEGNELGYSKFDEQTGAYIIEPHQNSDKVETSSMPKTAARVIVNTEKAAVKDSAPTSEAAGSASDATRQDVPPSQSPVASGQKPPVQELDNAAPKADDSLFTTEYVDPNESKCEECGSSFGVHLKTCSRFVARELTYEPVDSGEQPDPYDREQNKTGRHISVSQRKRLFAILNSAKVHTEEELRKIVNGLGFRDERFISRMPKAGYDGLCEWAGGAELKVK